MRARACARPCLVKIENTSQELETTFCRTFSLTGYALDPGSHIPELDSGTDDVKTEIGSVSLTSILGL
jgi:hypothetical protein